MIAESAPQSTPVAAVDVAATAGTRLTIIDGLRGVASMLVVVYHLCVAASLSDVPVIGYLLTHGNLGVEVFFVISGFVISYSVRNAEHTVSFLGRFALRRSLRLDPPYWLTIACEIVLIKLGLMLFPDHIVPLPTVGDVLAHLVYMQELLHRTEILSIFWSLCYEVQFYLVLVGTLVLVRLAKRKWSRLDKTSILIALGALSFVYSIAVDSEIFAYPIHGLFVDRWYQFCLGIITLAVISRWLPTYAVVLAWLTIGACLLLGPSSLYTAQSALTCVATSVVIVLSTRFSTITRLAETRTLQFLGRISYSLYLIHSVVGWRFASVALRLLPSHPSVIVRGIVFLLGVLISVLAAHLMYLVVERPSLKLAGRIRTNQRAG